MNNVTSPATGDSAIEQEIQAKGLTAPRVTPADLVANIASEHYFTAAEGVIGAFVAAEQEKGKNEGCPSTVSDLKTSLNLLTFCVIVLRNGFTVTGESACASPENFDAAIGRKIARENAVQKIWPLMGYELKERLHASALYGEPAAPPDHPYPVDTARSGANVHGIGPDTDGGPNPHFKG